MAYDKELDTAIILAVLDGNYEPVHRLMDVLCLAIRKGDVKIVEEYSQHLHIALIACGEFPSGLFSAVVALLQKPEFLRLQGSWHLLSVFELAWEFLSELQKESLLKVLETTYPVLTDWMACFSISGLLGECFRDERAFRVLCRLGQGTASMPRKFVAHGLEHLVKDCLDHNVALRALVELNRMRTDPSEEVRQEVQMSLARLAKVAKG